MQILPALTLARPTVATTLSEHSHELERREGDLRERESELDSQARAHRDQMKALQASGRKLHKGKNKALPFLIGSFATFVGGMLAGMITQQPALMYVGMAGLLGTVVSAAFVQASQDHIDEMGEKFAQHQETTQTLDGQKSEVERQLQSTRESLEGSRQLAAIAEPPAPVALAESKAGVTVAGVVLRRRDPSAPQQ